MKIWRYLFFRFVTIHAFDKQKDGQTEFSSLDRVCIPRSAVKIDSQIDKINSIYSFKLSILKTVLL